MKLEFVKKSKTESQAQKMFGTEQPASDVILFNKQEFKKDNGLIFEH